MSLTASLLSTPSAPTGTSNNSNVGITTDSSGRNTQPNQPKFLATTAGLANVTGDGTAYTAIFETAGTNVGTHYSVSTGLFTAPVAGLYQFSVSLDLSGILIGHTSAVAYLKQSVGTSKNFYFANLSPFTITASGALTVAGSHAIKLAASDTVEVVLTASGGTKVIDIANTSVFSGFLLG